MKVLKKQACHVMLRDQLSFIDFRGDHMVLWLNRSGIICRKFSCKRGSLVKCIT